MHHNLKLYYHVSVDEEMTLPTYYSYGLDKFDNWIDIISLFDEVKVTCPSSPTNQSHKTRYPPEKKKNNYNYNRWIYVPALSAPLRLTEKDWLLWSSRFSPFISTLSLLY